MFVLLLSLEMSAVQCPLRSRSPSTPLASPRSLVSLSSNLLTCLVKGMLTGPITILRWSFPRDDVPQSVQAKQLGLALRDEVSDLEKAGISVIQVDEPALREGCPLRRSEWDAYLKWAVDSFRIATASVEDD